MTRASTARKEEIHESRVEAPLAVLVAVILQCLLAADSLANGWNLWFLPGWTWLIAVIPELILVLVLWLPPARRQVDKVNARRYLSIGLVAVMGIANALALVGLIGSLLTDHEHEARTLLLKGFTVWGVNVITFGLLYWELDGGGPDARLAKRKPHDQDFQFPQQENPGLVSQPWYPRLFDYVYTSFTNSIAFSPTDAMPITHRAKVLMMLEATVSAISVLLVIARSVNIMN